MDSSRRVIRHPLDGVGWLGHLTAAVLVFPLAFLTFTFADAAFVCLRYGFGAYFKDGLRVVNWKRGVLSTGEELRMPWDLVRGVSGFLLWVASIVVMLYIVRGVSRLWTARRPG